MEIEYWESCWTGLLWEYVRDSFSPSSPKLTRISSLQSSLGKYYKLKDFPEGYALVELDRSVEPARGDKYLVGFDHHRYRSPEEFFPHAIWLMNGKVGSCNCKPGRKGTVVHYPNPEYVLKLT